MSSHHIIREKQEPALLVLGLYNFQDELLGQLLEWSPTLIVTADAAEKVNAFGIKFDVLIGDDVDAGNLQEDLKHIATTGNNPAQVALQYLVSNNYPAVNVVTDELALSDYLPYANAINIVIFNDGQKIYPVPSGFSKWKPAGEHIEVISKVDNLQFSGLESMGNNTYKTTHDGFINLQFTAPFIFISESIA